MALEAVSWRWLQNAANKAAARKLEDLTEMGGQGGQGCEFHRPKLRLFQLGFWHGHAISILVALDPGGIGLLSWSVFHETKQKLNTDVCLVSGKGEPPCALCPPNLRFGSAISSN